MWESLFLLDTHKIKIYVRVSDLTSRKMDYWTDEAHKEWEYHQWFTFLLPSSSIMIGSIDFRLFSSSWQNATKHKIIFSFLYSLFYIDIWSHNISNHYWRRLTATTTISSECWPLLPTADKLTKAAVNCSFHDRYADLWIKTLSNDEISIYMNIIDKIVMLLDFIEQSDAI